MANTFNAEKVQKDIDAQVVITQTFGTLASKAVGDYSQSQLNQAKTLREQAGQETDPTRAQTLRDQALQIETNWGDQGTGRLAAHTVIGALTGGTGGALGAAASTLSAPLISDTLAKAGVDPALSKILTAVGSTALGAAAGSATGGASGSTAGAAGALNEVANNYLSHSEALKREIALQQKQACTTDECRVSAQKTINELNQVDAWRDAQLQTACAIPSSSLCQGLNSALQIAKDSYTNYDPKSDINGTIAGERSQVNNQAFKYQQRVDNPFAYGVGKGLLKLSPPALVADVGYGAYSLTTAILENGLESTAINIAKGIADLPGELRARLNSTDPSTRGEALVDFIALGSGTAYLTQKLGLAVINTADQAIAKAVSKAAEETAAAKAAAQNKVSSSPVDIAHSIGGDYNPRYGRVTGGHSLLTNDVRIIEEISPPDIHGVYEARVEIKTPDGQWVQKATNNGVNTMFPKNWDAARIQTEIESAWAVRVIDPNKTNAWVGTSKSGLEIGGYLDPRTTAFPIYGKRK